MNKELRKTFALMRDHNVLYCAICGNLIGKKDKITLDHHIPKSKGGESNIGNLLPAHKICNEIKADLMPDEFEACKEKRFIYALGNWKLKYQDRRIIKQALCNFARQK